MSPKSPAPRSTPPRPLPPGMDVVSYSTPEIGDLLIVQDLDSRLPGYRAVEYGTPHPNTALYPNYKLVFQMPLDQEQNWAWVRRVYAKDRVDQDAYNSAIKYSSSHTTYPIYIRTYILPRAGYTAPAVGSTDPVHTTATFVDEEIQRLKDDQDDGQLDSLYMKVIRIYETLPGPTLTTTSKGSADVVPAKFKAQRQFTTHIHSDLPSATPDDTSATVIESVVTQKDNANKVEKSTTVIDAATDELLGKKLTAQQQIATVHERLVVTGDDDETLDPAHYSVDGSLIVGGATDPLGNGQSIRSVEIVPSVFPETAYKSEKSTWAVPHKFKAAAPPLTTSEVVAGTVHPSDVALALHDMEASSEQATVYKKKISKTTMPTGRIDLTGTRTGMWGVETVVDSLTESVSTAAGAYKTKDHIVDPLGDGRANETLTKYPDSPLTLTEYHMDEQHKIPVKMVKTLVAVQNYTPPSTGAQDVVEMHALDAWNGIQIISSINPDELPAPETWKHALHYNFPDELTEVGVVYEQTTSSDSKAGGTNSAPGVVNGKEWKVDASAEAGAMIRAVPYSLVKSGYSGLCQARTTRTFYTNVGDIPEVSTHQIIPAMGVLIITGTGGRLTESIALSGQGSTWLYNSLGSSRSTDVVAVRHTFGPHVYASNLALTEGWTEALISDGPGSWVLPSGTVESPISASGTAPSGSCVASTYFLASIKATLKLPLTSTPIASGDWIVADVRVEKWRLGVWIQEVTEVLRP